ncbi:Glycyl-glycine endopeptidase ALE-1 precursor [Micromonospora sp. MW-13]|uniref:M23 family metallopeptidase n=1 Tax=Micromonospora sp. MW-13 TaxID=2094022 RepID=UPI000E43D039|nr:M23 family metallopeptidase [Micromonospora sp. MW-13]RGC65189.1 Glycyl-glycine endopeptidase ALE-1 precursor [Micromonospora sp. MW-13]
MSSRFPRRRRVRTAYPVLLLLAPVLAAGCSAPPPSAAPSSRGWVGPTGPATADRPATPPAPPTPTPARPSASTAPTRAGLRHVFPVRAGNVDYHPTHSAYPGTDIFADCGEPVVAVTDGTILEVSRVDRFDRRGPRGPNNGGLSVSLLGDDGVRYYGSHLSAIATGIDAGIRVRAGQQLGRVGRTGNANNVCHLHFGISPPCTARGDWWIRRGVVWPARYLDSWRRDGNREPAVEVGAWRREHGCPKAPAAGGGGG